MTFPADVEGAAVPERPANVTEYVQWLADRGVAVDRQETHYETVAVVATQQFRESTLWRELVRLLPEWDDEYKLEKAAPLLIDTTPEVVTKSYGSFVLKTFRKNVLENAAWPEPPVDGWVEPPRWIYKVNDVVRTLLLVKYLDGVSVLAGKVSELASAHGIPCTTSLEATTEGYYAAHLTLRPTFRLPSLDFSLATEAVSVEIQISTQLQEAIRDLLHKHYEVRRKLVPSSRPWQWDYKSEEFSTNYLGHVLHYVEGKIVEVREHQEVET